MNLTALENDYLETLVRHTHGLYERLQRDEVVTEDPMQEAFLREKEQWTAAINGSHSAHQTSLQAVEDHAREREESRCNAFVEKLTHDEYLRNRHRMYEIHSLKDRYVKEIEYKLIENIDELDNEADD